MLIKKNEFKAQIWWALTKEGCRFMRGDLPSFKANNIKYLVLQGQQKHQDNFTRSTFWLDFFQVHDAYGNACNLFEDGIIGKVGTYDKSVRKLYCFITDAEGEGRPISFNGDISAVEKCIRYMQELSKASNWSEFLLEEQKQTIQRQKREIRLLKQEVEELERTLAAFENDEVSSN